MAVKDPMKEGYNMTIGNIDINNRTIEKNSFVLIRRISNFGGKTR